MNKQYYKRAFSEVKPSEETIERIFLMTEKKKRVRAKGLIIALAAAVLLVCAAFTANAATDGALFENMRLIINGEDVDPADYLTGCKSYVTEEGMTVESFEIEVPGESGGDVVVQFEYAHDASLSEGGDSDSGFVLEIKEFPDRAD